MNRCITRFLTLDRQARDVYSNSLIFLRTGSSNHKLRQTCHDVAINHMASILITALAG